MKGLLLSGFGRLDLGGGSGNWLFFRSNCFFCLLSREYFRSFFWLSAKICLVGGFLSTGGSRLPRLASAGVLVVYLLLVPLSSLSSLDSRWLVRLALLLVIEARIFVRPLCASLVVAQRLLQKEQQLFCI